MLQMAKNINRQSYLIYFTELKYDIVETQQTINL